MLEVGGKVKELHNKTIKTTSTEISNSLRTTPMFNTMSTDQMYLYKFTDFIYPGFYFERLVYLYVWETLVVFTSLVNVIIIFILLRKELRNRTNVVLVAIAISDSLTGLTTLPAYSMAYQQYETNHTFSVTIYGSDDGINVEEECEYAIRHLSIFEPQNKFQYYLINNQTESSHDIYCPYFDGYILKKEQCEWFMISKLFISPSFHLISIYLTMFLAIQRFLSVAAPYKMSLLKTKHVVVICLMIALLSPILHVYHLFDNKTRIGVCSWFVPFGTCQGGCIQLMMLLIIMHLIPCSVLLSFTIMFIRKLSKSEDAIRDMNVSSPQIKMRVVENRRISIIVVAIVIVFLIPEIPHACFLLLIVIEVINPDIQITDLETRTTMFLTYEVSLVVSYHVNIYIYTLFNPRFRTLLFKTFVQPVLQRIGSIRQLSAIHKSRNIVKSSKKTNTNTTLNIKNKPMTASPEFMNLESVGITQTTQEDEVGVCD